MLGLILIAKAMAAVEDGHRLSTAARANPGDPAGRESGGDALPISSGTVWLVASETPSVSSKFAAALRQSLASFAGPVQEVTVRQWVQQLAGHRGSGDLVLVMPDVALPPDSRIQLENYLRRGNHLLNLSPTAFSSLQEPIILETLSPSYKTHPTSAGRLRLPGKSLSLAADTPLTIPLPRPRGLGCGVIKPSRFVPVAEAVDREGGSRGAAAHLYLNITTEYAGAVWGGMGLPPAALEELMPDSVSLIADLVERVRRGLFLADAGPEHFAYADGESVAVGADLVNLSGKPQTVQVSLAITHEGREVLDWSTNVVVPAHTVTHPLHVGPPPRSLAPGQYQVDIRLRSDDRPVDGIHCPVQVIHYGPLPSRELVAARDGEFILEGRPWHPLGMNYWPHLSAGLEPKDFSKHWLSPEQYDPELVERDLALAERLGLNLLSIQYTDPNQARSMMDFLARAARHRLKVNIYSPAFEPLHPNPDLARRLILDAHLAESPALFAYDVCWEGHLGDENSRRASDPRWQAWVVERYGSVSDAETDWHYRPPQIAGILSGPTDQQLMNDGDWRVFVAAYRRFWDDEISRCYRAVRETIHEVDQIHLIGARSGYGGNGTPMYAHLMPFDLASGAKHLDFISPEGYALSGDRQAFLRGGLTTAYSRLVGGGKPVFWAEYGVPLRWQVEPQAYRPVEKAEELAPQQAYFHRMLRFVRESGANGCSGWWWPGGYRVDEKSDFGIINPDGTLRPAARELLAAVRDYAAAWPQAPADTLLDLDRDRYVNGYAGLYTAMTDHYVQLYLGGHTPGVRTAGTGTTSADTPPIAVGNVPWTGRNPPKYLNAEFSRIEVQDGEKWRRIENGAQAVVPAGKVRLRVSVTNTAEACWLTPGDKPTGGGVILEVSDDRGSFLRLPLPHPVPFLGDAVFPEFEMTVGPNRPAEFLLHLQAEKRTPFGERFHAQLKARP